MKTPSVITGKGTNRAEVHKLFALKSKQNVAADFHKEKKNSHNAVSRWFYISLISAACSDVCQTLLRKRWTRLSKCSNSH